MQVIWDHRLPSGKRVKSIHLLEPPKDEEDGIESPDDMVDFVEQEDGTRVEVKQRKSKIGEEVINDSSKTYRVVRERYLKSAEPADRTRSLVTTWHKGK